MRRLEFSRREIAIAAAKIVALALLLAPDAWWPEISSTAGALLERTRFGGAPVLYIGVVILSLAGLAVTPFLRSTGPRVALVALLLTAYGIDRTVFSLSGTHVDTNLVRTFHQQLIVGGDAFDAYRGLMLWNLTWTIALGAVLAWAFPRGLRSRAALLPVAGFAAVALHYWSFQGMLEGYPSPFAMSARLLWVWHEPPTNNDLPLEPVAYDRSGERRPVFRKIVFIVDESVRGDYLSINDDRMDTTPFLRHSADRLINFGLAVSGGNCSFQSQWMLRRGIRPWQLPDQRAATGISEAPMPGPRTTMWQFARAAGFRTVYLDGWAPDAITFHDGMTPEEAAAIDLRVPLGSLKRSERDLDAARRLVSLLREAGPAFIYINKTGVHFPYDGATPPDFNQFAHTDGSRFVYRADDRSDLVGSYKNAVAWSVDRFFREILEHGDLTDTLLLYTSDHGQSLLDGDYSWGHCSGPAAHPSELWVPIVAVSGNEAFGRSLSSSAARAFNKATHFEIFPTILLAMGYDAGWVTHVYGSSLLDAPDDRARRFVIGDVIGHGKRTWVDVGAPSPDLARGEGR